MAVLVVRLVFGLVLVAIPESASANIVATIIKWLRPDENYQSDLASAVNSQTVPLLKSVVNQDPVSGQGGGDITVVGGTALISETGPSGSMADIGIGESSDHISVYVVRQGDTVSGIAKMFGVSVNTVIWSNDIQRGLIREGQTLVILPITGVQHIVKSGDTIQSIAKKYKGDVDEILKYNSLSLNSKLKAGEVVIIPDGEIAMVPTVSGSATLRGAGGPEYSGYYMRPVAGGRKSQGLHGYNGVDLAGKTGSHIYASADGQVIVARNGGWNGGYGTYIVIKHQNSTQTLYAHLSGITVITGQEVKQGQVIGYLGSTGRSTGPHLHFEIRGAKNPF